MKTPDDVDDLDALLDDAINTMNEEEHRHEEKVKARDAARATEQKNASAVGSEAEMMQKLMESLMGDGDADSMEEMIKNFTSQISGMTDALENLPDMTEEERAQLLEVRSLMGQLDGLTENKPDETSNATAGHNTASDEQIAEALKQCMSQLQNLNVEENAAGDSATEAAAAATAAASLADGVPSMENLMRMFFKVVFDPQLGDALHVMRDSYPPWFVANEATTNAKDLERYKKQYEAAAAVCNLLDEGPLTSEEDTRTVTVIDLLQKLSECSPPPENLSEYLPPRPEATPSDLPTDNKQ